MKVDTYLDFIKHVFIQRIKYEKFKMNLYISIHFETKEFRGGGGAKKLRLEIFKEGKFFVALHSNNFSF